MAAIPRIVGLKDAHDAILESFNANEIGIFSIGELREFIRSSRDHWRLSANVTRERVIEYLMGTGQLQEIQFKSLRYSSRSLYTWGHVSNLRLALAFAPQSYFSHQTAAFLHGLIRRIPAILYVNREQAKKEPREAELSQQAIDKAFRNRPRRSNYIFSFRNTQVCVISGKNTDRLEVGMVEAPKGESVPATTLQRTLIDLAVRPQYAGGVDQVLAAYRAAKRRVSTRGVIDTLRILNYVYPYHQSIGFYMWKAGYPESVLAKLKSIGMRHDFYLMQGIKGLEYVPDWRVYAPNRLV